MNQLNNADTRMGLVIFCMIYLGTAIVYKYIIELIALHVHFLYKCSVRLTVVQGMAALVIIHHLHV
jgi:hypothetical protein